MIFCRPRRGGRNRTEHCVDTEKGHWPTAEQAVVFPVDGLSACFQILGCSSRGSLWKGNEAGGSNGPDLRVWSTGPILSSLVKRRTSAQCKFESDDELLSFTMFRGPYIVLKQLSGNGSAQTRSSRERDFLRTGSRKLGYFQVFEEIT